MKVSYIAGALALATVSAPGVASAQHEDRQFDGPYVGLEVSLENVVGGALVGGVDVLAQSSRPAVTLVAGYRRQFSNGLVLGAEAGIAWEDGDLALSNSRGRIDYTNSSHWRAGGIVGVAVGDERDTLLFAYVNETKRDFDIVATDGTAVSRQTDEQGLLRFGIGVERAYEDWALRFSAGTSHADFGDRPTNIEPDRPIDLALGVTRQF